MCAHNIVVSSEYIALSCSKLFSDGSARKIRVLATDAKSNGAPAFIAESSLPQNTGIMVSPQDSMILLRQSAVETHIIYSVGATLNSIDLVADNSNVGHRETINIRNLCMPPESGKIMLQGGNS